MEKLRFLLAAVLGLTLWFQGIAIAGAPLAAADAADSAPAPTMEMPCHGDEASSPPPCDCCDGDCAGMLGCAGGSLAGAPNLSVRAEAPLHAAIAVRSWSSRTAVLPLPLRPPIATHA